ncbi:hypothetical protein G0Q06_01855 [Puniceicoccales bacterium CK1056]|uniref:Uncharacterized protein n=1 Tax=Oceanipulchritudo coccoides TaxID=2706888 RepID=A0A6B2LYS6_9BACT|nr:hypothetical protein [Oceanipulchritudo coccoides]NDV61189.1 hypothetical protein [Oceanipulchritudo coccoides]
MRRLSQSGFILPQALLFAASILVIATFQLKEEIRFSELGQIRALHDRAALTLRLNANSLVPKLERDLLEAPVASALLGHKSGPEEVFEAVRILNNPKNILPLHSPVGAGEPTVRFQAGSNPSRHLVAGWMKLSEADSPVALSLAWAAEDCSLVSGDSKPPKSWPLPSWELTPYSADQSLHGFLDQKTHGNWIAGPWIPASDPIPFLPEASPAFVPVVKRMSLKFGIFASGPLRNREKTVRLRFYVEGELWNPYNRPLQFHGGTGDRAVFQVLFFNLPVVRLINQSNGFSSGWISLDEARNSASGKDGLSAWIELPNSLQPGEHHPFFEPDPSWQPEGLARTLHPGFLIGPGDRVRIEFKPSEGGVHAACMSTNSDTSPEAALAGEGWFRLEAMSADWPVLEFDRADSGERPFFLEEGSLSFQPENTHLKVEAALRAETLTLLDPRRRRIQLDQEYPLGNGNGLMGHEWFNYEVMPLVGDLPAPSVASDPPDAQALFSWPVEEPGTLLEASDLPQWPNGYLLGSPGASEINAVLDRFWIDGPDSREDLVELALVDGTVQKYHNTFHINQLGSKSWSHSIALEGTASAVRGALAYPAFATPNPNWEGDQIVLEEATLEEAADKLVIDIKKNPYGSISEFFNRGRLVELLQMEGNNSIFPSLLALRAWLRKAPPPSPRGSAWILHLAIRARQEQKSILKTARLWLLEVQPEAGNPGFEIIRFEWTNPDSVVAEFR